VDFDPDGIGIMSTYKYGSVTLSHQNQLLIVPSINWLGVQSTDIIPIEESGRTGLMRLSTRDRRIANCMLERPAFQGGVEPEWRRELQVMLMLNCKAEIQILSDGGTGLKDWLDRKLIEALNSRAT
jgi:meiotic recombination protein SPO11